MEALRIFFVIIAIINIIVELLTTAFDDKHKISIHNILGWICAIIWCIN